MAQPNIDWNAQLYIDGMLALKNAWNAMASNHGGVMLDVLDAFP